jgi:hypothetical protein
MQFHPQSQQPVGTPADNGPADHDLPYQFGRMPRSSATYPFTTRQYVHLLVLRSRLQAGLFAADDLCAA